MVLFTLQDLQMRRQFQQPLTPRDTEFAIDPTTPANFQLVIRQLFLGLPVQPLLEAHPQMAGWVAEVKALAPELFQPKKKLEIDRPVIAPLALDEDQIFIQVSVNLGFRRGIPRLYEWAVRQPELSWQDRVKLWATTIGYALAPEQVQLVILALHPMRPAHKRKLTWNTALHQQTERSLVQLLTQPLEQVSNFPYSQSLDLNLIDLEAIPEVVL
jgi:hypothetical protein